VHAHGWIAYSCLAAARRDGPPVIVGVHDYGHACAKKTMVRADASICPGPELKACLSCSAAHYGAAKGWALTTGLRASTALHGRAACFVANSRAVADATRRRLPAGARVEVVAPTPPGNRHASARRPSFLPADDGYVLFVGALAEHKGLDVLIDAWRSPGLDAPLVVLGAGGEDRVLPDGITVARDVEHADVMAAWKHCAVGVVPSVWSEPFGLVAVEAMASGQPVVASAVGGLTDIIVDGETGVLVPAGDPVALRVAVNQLLADPQRRARMGEAARFRASRFAKGPVVDQMEEVYRSVARRMRYDVPVTVAASVQRAASFSRP
jgi:glycosyltransferase involved in cell wall biosynthesis